MTHRSVFLAAALCVAAATSAQARNDTGYLPTDAADPAPAASAGLRVIVDPYTGELVNEPVDAMQAERIDQQRMPNPDYTRFKTQEVPGLGVLLDTNGQLRMNAMVRMKPDGSFEEYCVTGAQPQTGEQP
jgi:hypothetical protein